MNRYTIVDLRKESCTDVCIFAKSPLEAVKTAYPDCKIEKTSMKKGNVIVNHRYVFNVEEK